MPPPLPPLPPGYTLDASQPQAAPQMTMPQPFRGPAALPQAQTPDQANITHQTSIRMTDQNEHIDPDTLHMLAQKYVLDHQVPAFGMGNSVDRRNFWQAVFDVTNSRGQSGGDLAAAQARFSNGVRVLQGLETNLGQISTNEQTAHQMAMIYRQQAAQQPGNTNYPFLNSIARRFGFETGDSNVPAANEARNSFTGNYARVTSSTPSGSGQLTDSAREQTLAAFNPNMSMSQLDNTLRVMNQDMAARREAYQHNIVEGYRRLANGEAVSIQPNGDILDENGHLIPPTWLPAGMRPPPGIAEHGSGVIGPAGMLSGHPTGPVPPPPGPGGSPPPGGGNPPSGSPAGGIANGIGAGPPVDHHGDAVVFGMDRTPPPPPPNAGPLPGGAEFAGALQEAIRTQHFRSVAEAMRFATQLNPYLAQTVNQRDLAAAIRNPALAGVAVPHGTPPAPPPPPDISAQRGDQADPRQIAVQNALRRSIYNNLGGGGAMIAGPSGVTEMFSGPEAGAAALRGSEDVASVGLAPRMNALSDTITQGGTYQNNLDQQQAIDNFDTSNHPFARFGGEAATGAPFAMLGGANVGRQMIASGGYGALHGFNSGQGDMADRATNALVQGGIGAALPVAGAAVSAGARGAAPYLGGAARWVAGRARPNVTPAGQEIAAAGAAENVPVSGPMLDPSTRSRMAYLESSLGSGGPVNQSLDATQAAIQNRMAQISGPGAASEAGAMGERVQAAGRRYVAASGQRIGAMYQRAAQMAGDTPIIPVQAVQRLEGHIADLQQNPGQNAPLINFLNTVRGDLLDQTGALAPKTVQAIRDMRTNLNGNIAQANLTHTPAERIMGDVLDGARQDVNVFLGSTNPAANRLYQQADQQWAGRHAEITQIVDRLVGRADNPIGGGAVMNRVSGLASGDVPRLQRVVAMLSPEERADLQATIASRAGYKSPDEPFSLQQFVSWQRALPNGARQAIFGADGAASIRNLTVLARALQDTRGALNNSRSGQVQNWGATLRGFLGGHWPSLATGAVASTGTLGAGATTAAITGGATTALLTAAGAGMRRLSAKALMNPDLSAWLPGALRASTPAAVRSALGRLSGIAARNPAIAQEVTGLRQALSGANDNFGTAAAASGADSQPQYGNDQSGYAPRQ